MSITIPDPTWIHAGTAATQRAGTILANASQQMRDTQRIEEQGRETKIRADEILHEEITDALTPTGLPVFSEEGNISSPDPDQWCWVIDPLDGSANFQRGFSLCASSIALCYGMQPISGFIYDLHTRAMIQGGAGIPHAEELRCSTTKTLDRAILCTGIPARLQWSNENTERFSNMFRAFYKIRMLGSAVQALLHVATGKADVYFEQNIMFWDVAAAWAIAETAGIQILSCPGTRSGSLQVLAAPKDVIPHCRPLLLPESTDLPATATE